VAFDCDWTLYPYDCDKDRVAPFENFPYGTADYYGRPSAAYPDVPQILGAIADAGIPVAFLSRNPSSFSIEDLLTTLPLCSIKFGPHASLWDTMPDERYFHAYSSGGYGKGKDRHFDALQKVSGIRPKQILFFDDLKENIDAAVARGTMSVLVGTSGLTWAAFADGILGWRKMMEKIEPSAQATEQHPERNGPA
jgi:magnesium-dependent phosphatase-1